jgi:hypothetical protein
MLISTNANPIFIMTNSIENQENRMISVSLPEKTIRELKWLKEKTGVATLTEALNQALSTEAYILTEIEKNGSVHIAKRQK